MGNFNNRKNSKNNFSLSCTLQKLQTRILQWQKILKGGSIIFVEDFSSEKDSLYIGCS